MSTQDEKLNKFRQAVFAEADKQAAEILSDIDKHRQEELEKAKNDALELHFHSMQAQLGQIKQDCKRDVSKADLQAKRELLMRREQLSDQVFDAVRERLRAFTATGEYREYLLRKIGTALASCPTEGSQLYLTAADMALAPDIQRQYAGLSLQQLDGGEIGGFLLKNEALGIAVDETLDSLLEGQREYFNNISGLRIE